MLARTTLHFLLVLYVTVMIRGMEGTTLKVGLYRSKCMCDRCFALLVCSNPYIRHAVCATGPVQARCWLATLWNISPPPPLCRCLRIVIARMHLYSLVLLRYNQCSITAIWHTTKTTCHSPLSQGANVDKLFCLFWRRLQHRAWASQVNNYYATTVDNNAVNL